MAILHKVRDSEYAGFSYEEASRRALEVCRLAGENGQTLIAADHLAALSIIMRQAS